MTFGRFAFAKRIRVLMLLWSNADGQVAKFKVRVVGDHGALVGIEGDEYDFAVESLLYLPSKSRPNQTTAHILLSNNYFLSCQI